ncbi:BofC N-terminal domain-containing protein [Jeotgalibacillus sp. R-1-5s-1]|uniref:BofC N-terminal domain-containing protein n=1 Tax=Jeotgalibacillus sp. R-1-5s-1 TaxID=2555897 RepID=UPI00141BC08F|nr:BofC N-terminal domain-containing protein [Jeotgalibacillus sp. R-1-5s-1]
MKYFILSAALLTILSIPQHTSAHTITIDFETIFLDGEKGTETRQENFEAMEDFWSLYEGWQLVDMSEEKVVLRKSREELSPLSAMNGYTPLITKE